MFNRLLVVSVAAVLAVACDDGGDGDVTPIDGDDASVGAGGEGGGAGGEGGGAGGEGGQGGAGGSDDPDMGAPEPDAAPRGLAILGNDSHDIENVTYQIIGTRDDGLNVPRDLAFNPEKPGELWVVNRRDDSTSTFFEMGMDNMEPESRHLVDPFALHFMEEVSSIAFGDPEIFATCQESRNTYNNQAAGNDFMGPALWSSDFDIYARTNPDAVDFVGADLGSHLDMLHESPLCMGIEWEFDNKYFAFEGMTNSIARNDFRRDHGPGYDDHSDGVIERYAEGEFAMVPDVPSHMYFDFRSELLYIADTGNSRIAVLNVASGRRGAPLQAVEPGTQLYAMEDVDPVVTLFEHEELSLPSGIARYGDHLYISDNETGRIWAITLDGEVVDYLDMDVTPGALMGLEFDDNGVLYGVNAGANQLWRIAPK